MIVIVCVVAALASPWTISIPPAHAAERFGFQTPACWLVVLALLVASVVEDTRVAVLAVAAGECLLIAWFGWAMWVVTTQPFAQLPFPFVGTDLLGPGWYVAALGLLVAAGSIIKRLLDRDAPLGPDFWVLASLPGFGLLRLRKWGRGLIWATSASTALYLAQLNSPGAIQFQEYGRSNTVPPSPPTRAPEWFLLGLAALLWALGAADAIHQRRRLEQRGPNLP